MNKTNINMNKTNINFNQITQKKIIFFVFIVASQILLSCSSNKSSNKDITKSNDKLNSDKETNKNENINESINLPREISFKITKRNVKEAEKFIENNCKHVFPYDEQYENDAKTLRKTIWAMKAIDLKNNISWTFCLLNEYNRHRLDAHKGSWSKCKNKYMCLYDDPASKGNPYKWWDKHPYKKYLNNCQANEQMWSNMVGYTLNTMTKYVLPKFNFNPYFSHTICDDMNGIIKMALASWGLSNRLLNGSMQSDYLELKVAGFIRLFSVVPIPSDLNNIIKRFIEEKSTPVQLDFWIIPRFTKSSIVNPDKLKDYDEVDDVDDDIFNNIEFNKMYKENLKESNNTEIFPYQDLEEYLIGADYKKDTDYFREYAQSNLLELKRQLEKMLLNYIENSYERRRFIFIFDRRNPKNLKGKKITYLESELETSNTYQNTIYLFQPKIHSKGSQKEEESNYQRITEEYKKIPEILLQYPRKYMFPSSINPMEDPPITVSDSLNGHMFVLSYHLIENFSAVYWYFEKGAQKFELEDMEWLWPRFFNKDIGGVFQEISDENKVLICKEKYFPNPVFEKYYNFFDRRKFLNR